MADDDQHAAAKRVASDFVGTWLQTSTEGDFEQYLKTAEMPWALRRIAWAGDYGVNRVTQTLAFDEETMELTLTPPTAPGPAGT